MGRKSGRIIKHDIARSAVEHASIVTTANDKINVIRLNTYKKHNNTTVTTTTTTTTTNNNNNNNKMCNLLLLASSDRLFSVALSLSLSM